MSFVTTACGGAAAGSPTPAEPCPHNGAATSEATATVAHQRAQCVIPTSVEDCGGLLPRAQRESDVHVAPRSGLVVPPPRGVDHHRPYVGPVEHNVETHARAAPEASEGPVPPHAHGRGPP